MMYQEDTYDDTKDYAHQYERKADAGRWSSFLLGCRFVFLGLGGRVHAVLQIGVVYGLLLYVLIEV